jgi:hypothetical protein
MPAKMSMKNDTTQKASVKNKKMQEPASIKK